MASRSAYVYARINVLENVLAQLVVFATAPRDSGQIASLDAFRHNVRQVCKRVISMPAQDRDEAIEIQAAMLQMVEEFFGLVEKLRGVSLPSTDGSRQ